jgi:hypothetical protein
MARVVAPLLSFEGSGQIAHTQVYAQWKGIPYVRRYVIPANPQSAGQSLTRNVFKWLNNVWRIAPADFAAPWTAAAAGRPLTNRNLFLSQNVGLLREETSLDGMVLSPGAKGGIAVTPTITAGDDQITFASATPTPLPSGWTIVKMVGVAIREQDPQSGQLYTITAVSDASDPYSVVMSSLASATEYAAGAWFVYQRSASATDLAYGPSFAELVTTT